MVILSLLLLLFFFFHNLSLKLVGKLRGASQSKACESVMRTWLRFASQDGEKRTPIYNSGILQEAWVTSRR